MVKLGNGRKYERYYWIFIVFFVVLVLYFTVGQLVLEPEIPINTKDTVPLNEGWVKIDSEGHSCAVETGEKISSNSKKNYEREAITIKNTLPSYEINNLILMFWNREYDLEIRVGDENRLKYPRNEMYKFFGDCPGSENIWIRLYSSDRGKDIEITFSNVDELYLPEFVMGKSDVIHIQSVMPYVSEMAIAIFLMLISVICIVVCVVMEHLFNFEIILKYFCWATLITSIWILVNSIGRQYIFANVSVVRDVAFMSIGLLPIPFYIFIDKIQSQRYHNQYKTLSYISVGALSVCILLHIMGISDLGGTQRIVQLNAMVGIGYMIATIINDVYKKRVKDYMLTAIGFCIMGFFSVIHIIRYIVSITKIFKSVFIELGLSICLIIAIINMVSQVSRFQSERKNAIYASKAKDEFLARMSHEIRTPINAILGMNEMILRESRDDGISEYASQVKIASNTLLSIVNDILDFSKIESGKMEIIDVEYEFTTLIVDLVNMIKPRAIKKKLYLKTEIDENLPTKLRGDDIRIKQIVVNILTNAVKYTHRGGVILKISLISVKGNTAVIRYSVKDTGIGIRAADRDKLFKSFERIEEKKNRNIEGTGLGLSITGMLLSLMNTEIKLESEYQKGSEFWFDLEQEIVDDTPIGDFEKNYKGSVKNNKEYKKLFYAPKAKVLVVDDVAVNVAVVKGLLKKTGVQVTTASSGLRCLEKMKEDYYDIVLLDHFMPELDGVETLTRIRAMEDERARNTVVIVLTANAIAGEKEKYIKKGFNDFLEKPVNSNLLEEILLKYIPNELIEEKKET